jgi:hypothetical protein
MAGIWQRMGQKRVMNAEKIFHLELVPGEIADEHNDRQVNMVS